jgi:hypothetical protein
MQPQSNYDRTRAAATGGQYAEQSRANARVHERADVYDDDFVEILGQRLARQVTTELVPKLKNNTPSSNQRLALAIVSLIVLLAISATAFSVGASTDSIWQALLAIFLISVAVSIINIVFNISHRE